MDEPARLNAVAEYWANAPLMTIAYDPADAANWPTPWEMVHANNWCRNSVAIGMESTLRLAGFPTERMRLALIIDRSIEEMVLCLIVDDQWLLNYDWGTVRQMQHTFATVRAWQYKDRAYVPLY